MESDAGVEQKTGDAVVDQVKPQPVATAPFRYTKEELLEIKELPISNERPECLSEKYDSEGVWDPEKWHASLYPTSERSSPVDGFKKDYMDERVPLKRRIPDPRERLKEDDLDVILSPQRRSFGGGCQGNAVLAPHARRPISPLENKENESLRLGGARRIGSGRIIAARAFEREARPEKERDFKDKRFRRDFGDKRVFGERRRNDSYAEEEPEWFSGGPTSQSETIELIGFDDKILEDDKRKSKRSRKRPESLKEAVECNGGQTEEQVLQSTADQEVPHPDVLPEQTTGIFDFNEFFNLEKTMPGLASMIEDVLGEGPVSASRFSQWFSSNMSPSGSRSSSLRSTPHEELEKLAGFEPRCTSPSRGPAPYFTPIQSSDCKEKVDILELLHKAKIDLKPLLSTLSVNKARLRESTNCGAVLSLEEVEGEMKGMKLGSEPQVRKVPPPQRGNGTPFMAEHLEEALTGGSGTRPHSRDSDMSAFNKLVSSMKASGTLPTHPKTNSNNQPSDQTVGSEAPVPPQQQKNIFQELLGGPARSGSPPLLGNLLGSSEGPTASAPLHRILHKGPSPPLFPQRAPSPDYFNSRLQTSGFPVGPQTMLPEQFADVHRSISPGSAAQQQMRALSMPVNQADLEALAFQQDLALHAHHSFQSGYKQPQDKSFRNRLQRTNRSPGPGPQPAGRNSPGNPVTSMVSINFILLVGVVQVSKHSAEMLHNLNAQRKDGGRFCDVILRVGEESFPAHKAVLAACSEYFESVFSRQTEGDGDARELEMHTISPKVFKDVLDFAYTSRIVVRLECFPELMTAAKFLLMRSVIEICQEVIKQSNVQILVPTSRGGDASLFQAAGAAELGFPVAQPELVNGTGMMLVNGQGFANDAQMPGDGGEDAAAAVLLEERGETAVPTLEPVEGLSVSPPTDTLGDSFHHDAGSPGSKRGRGRPKKAGGPVEAVHFNHGALKDNGLFPCGTCGKAFTEASRLKNHEAQHGAHGGGANSVRDGLSAAGISLLSPAGLVENGVQLHGGLTLDNGRKRERTRRHVGCDICGKVFRDVYHLNRHKLSHSGEKPYACPVCGLRFKRKDRMSYHVRSHDGSVGKPYVCQSCGKGFSRPDHLNGHIKQVHTTERPHKCQICNASFATRDRLRSHLACHEDKIPCKVCGKFLRAAYMTDHLKKHSEGTHNYCGICNKDGQENTGKCPHLESEESDPSFGELPNGDELRSPHKPDDGSELEMPSLACNGASAGGLGSPEGAKAKTDPEKKFTCGICGQAFRTKSYLNKHQHRVHKAQKAQGVSGSSLNELAPSLTSPFSPQQNMSLLESFGFQIVQSAFASSLVDAEAGQSGMDFGGK